MRRFGQVGLFLLLSILMVLSPGTVLMATSGLPLALPPGQWQPLEQCRDPILQMHLDRSLKQRPGWQGLIAAQKMAVGLVDLSSPRAPRFAQVNGDVMLYAASLPKLAVLLAAFQAIEDRRLSLTPQLKQDLGDMIRLSSNPAAAGSLSVSVCRRSWRCCLILATVFITSAMVAASG